MGEITIADANAERSIRIMQSILKYIEESRPTIVLKS